MNADQRFAYGFHDSWAKAMILMYSSQRDSKLNLFLPAQKFTKAKGPKRVKNRGGDKITPQGENRSIAELTVKEINAFRQG